MLENKNYGKLENGVLIYAPKNVLIDNTWHMPASGEQLISLGYKTVVDTICPTDGKSYSASWEEQSDKIIRVWTEIPDTRTPEEKREAAYQTEVIIDYNGKMITVDEARNICLEYMFDGTDRSSAIISTLSNLIAIAKADIRNRYPDEV